MLFTGYTAIFGGSFNPPHLGHQMACLYLLEGLAADQVWLLPAHVHAFNKPLIEFEHRRVMCGLMARIFGGRVQVSDAEHQPQASGRTYDTLRFLQSQNPERRFFLVIGQDVLRETEQWYRWKEIETMCPVVVIGRQGNESTGQSAIQLPNISSTEIRRRIKAHEPLSGLVPASIAEYIQQQGLYL